MNHYHQLSAYKHATQTVHKTRQIVMLYDGMIRFLQQAKQANSEKNITERYKLVTRASDIVTGLQSCLDFSQNEEIASVLHQYYETTELRLFGLHNQPKDEDFDMLIQDIRAMRDVWQKIDKQQQPNEATVPTMVTRTTSSGEDIDVRALLAQIGVSV